MAGKKKTAKKKPAAKAKKEPVAPIPKASDDEAVCATCGVIFKKKDPKPGSKCGACSKK